MDKQLLAFRVMDAVEKRYTEFGKSDSEFAKMLSGELGAEVTLARVRQCRSVLKVPNNIQQVASVHAQTLEHLTNVVNILLTNGVGHLNEEEMAQFQAAKIFVFPEIETEKVE